MPDLSPAEALVATWVQANPRLAVDAAIGKVAAAAGVSEPTVIRFCRRMGADGFRSLKARLIAELQRPESYLHHDVVAGDNPGQAAAKVLDNAIRILLDQRNLAAAMPFADAVATLARARQLVFVGLGASGHVARDASHKFFRLGIPCATALDTPTIAQHAAIASPADAFLAISHTGDRAAIVRAMADAVVRGACVIAITDPVSPLARAASWVFPCHAAEDTSVFTPMSSRLAQLALLDALQVTLALHLGAPAEENLRRCKTVLQSAEPPR